MMAARCRAYAIRSLHVHILMDLGKAVLATHACILVRSANNFGTPWKSDGFELIPSFGQVQISMTNALIMLLITKPPT